MQAVSSTDIKPVVNNRKKALNRILKNLVLPGTGFDLHSSDCAERSFLEAYIADKFKESHQANISEFMPYLMSVKCQGGVSAAVGVRKASEEALFVEQYMDRPVEQEISRLTQSPTDRDSIIEIGNLVGTQRGASQLVFILLTAIVHRAGYHSVVFTATQQVQQLIGKLLFKLTPVCEADPSRLGDNAAQWGNYYDNNPQVVVGDLASTMEQAYNNPVISCVLEHYEGTIQSLADQLRQG